MQREAVRTARDAAEREANQTLPKSEKYRSSGGVSVLDVPIVDVPIESGANGNNKYTTKVEETQAAFAQGNIFTEYLCDFTLGGASAVPWQLYYVYMENRSTQWVMCSIQTSK